MHPIPPAAVRSSLPTQPKLSISRLVYEGITDLLLSTLVCYNLANRKQPKRWFGSRNHVFVLFKNILVTSRYWNAFQALYCGPCHLHNPTLPTPAFLYSWSTRGCNNAFLYLGHWSQKTHMHSTASTAQSSPYFVLFYVWYSVCVCVCMLYICLWGYMDTYIHMHVETRDQ